MSKIVKLSKRAVVLSTLLVLGSLTALPVAYANNVIGQPDPVKYCADQGYQYSPYYNACLREGTSLNPDLKAIPNNDGLCSENYPGSKFQEHPFGCVRA
jgi:hypothetical protein